nr:MAG TPA: hypothetical protein [Caudoviricetes sp.]
MYIVRIGRALKFLPINSDHREDNHHALAYYVRRDVVKEAKAPGCRLPGVPALTMSHLALER